MKSNAAQSTLSPAVTWHWSLEPGAPTLLRQRQRREGAEGGGAAPRRVPPRLHAVCTHRCTMTRHIEMAARRLLHSGIARLPLIHVSNKGVPPALAARITISWCACRNPQQKRVGRPPRACMQARIMSLPRPGHRELPPATGLGGDSVPHIYSETVTGIVIVGLYLSHVCFHVTDTSPNRLLHSVQGGAPAA